MAEDIGERVGPIFRDIRRYYCDYCGICRSKKSLITAHILALHKDEMEKEKGPAGTGESGEGKKLNTCEECGGTFSKPAYLKQHMQSHSLEGERYFSGVVFSFSPMFIGVKHWIPMKELQNARGCFVPT